MNHFSLDHAYASSRLHCQSLLESCFGIDPGYLRPVLQISKQARAMTWFFRSASDIESTITAWVSPTHESTGYIGLVRSQDDQSTNGWNSLFDQAETWLKLQGVKSVFAPVDRATWFDYRLGVEGAEKHFQWEPMRQVDLQKTIESRGYLAAVGFHSTGFESQDFARALKRLEPSFDAATKAGFTIQSVQDSDRDELLSVIFDITTEVYSGAPCFEPIDRQAFEELYRHYNSRRNVSLSQILRDAQSNIVGFLYAFEDQDLAVIKTIGILPQVAAAFPNPKTSASQAMLYLALKSAQAQGLTGGVAALIRDSASSRILEKTQLWAANWRHHYHLYHRHL